MSDKSRITKRILFVAAHPDDEVLGAGAFIYDAVKRGDQVAVLIFNTKDTTRYKEDPTGLIRDIKASHKVLGVQDRFLYTYDDSNFHNENHRQMVKDIEQAIRCFEPDYIFTQLPGDINTDHYWTAATCMEAFRLFQRGRETIKPIKGLYLFEVQSSTDWALNPAIRKFEPNTFIKVSEEAVNAKIEALKCYENVVRESPHPRSVEALKALPLLRGAQAGVPLAEAFECVYRMEEDL